MPSTRTPPLLLLGRFLWEEETHEVSDGSFQERYLRKANRLLDENLCEVLAQLTKHVLDHLTQGLFARNWYISCCYGLECHLMIHKGL